MQVEVDSPVVEAGMLSDADIRTLVENGSIRITNDVHNNGRTFDLEEQIQLNAIDLYLGSVFRRYNLADGYDVVTSSLVEDKLATELFDCPPGGLIRINPGELLLGTTQETVVLDQSVSGLVVARNSIGRLGILVTCSAPLIKPGHPTNIPLQLVNLNKYPVELSLGKAVCQIIFFKLTSPASERYGDWDGAKYVNESAGPSDSKYYEDEELSPYQERSNALRQAVGNLEGHQSWFRRVVSSPSVREVGWVFAGVTVIEFLATKITSSLGDTISFFKDVPLSLIMGVLTLIVLFNTSEGKSE